MTNTQKLKNYFTAILIGFVWFGVFALSAQAAEILPDSKIKEIGIGSQFEASILIYPEGENINAVAGNLLFSQDLLELREIRDGNSIINFWVEKPRQVGEGVVFSGIIPGGYTADEGLIFSLVFYAKKEGAAFIEIRDAKTLLNDGKGTETKTETSILQIAISSKAPSVLSPSKKDNEPPESFVPEIASDPGMFEGKHFLVFATQDKSSGVSHYEVRETRQRFLVFSKWIEAESPHVLRDQKLRSYVFVKAVDKTGNERVMKILPKNPLRWYENYENWIIIIVGFVVAYAFRKFLWRKHIKT